MSKYQYLKTKVNRILEDKNCLTTEILNCELENLVQELLSTIRELEPVEIDPEFFNWQSRKFSKLYPLSIKVREVYKEKSEGTKVRVGLLYNNDDLALYKPNKLKSPAENPNYIEGLNWSTYWFYLDEDNKKVKFTPSNRINEIFEDPWSTYEFNALGYKTPNGTIVHYDSYIED
jgi:hypothetical protein